MLVLAIIVAVAVSLPLEDEALRSTDKPLGIDDFVGGDNIDIDKENEQDLLNDAIETGHEYEGDILLTPEQASIIINGTENDLISMRSAIKERHWPKKGSNVIIPYTISGTYSPNERNNIARAMDEYEKNTCIRIIPRTTEPDYIAIHRGEGCWSKLGKTGGKQQLSLAKGCAYDVGTPVHELMHAIGYWHEQMRSDRDDYVQIIWSNIQDGRDSQFTKCKSCDNQGLEYDVKSVMHYHAFSFAKDRTKPTIELLDGSTSGLGQRNGFSPLDIEGINMLYCTNVVTKPDPDCSNGNTNCAFWATKKKYCTEGAHVEYMAKNCKKACDKCCKDIKTECAGWSDAGYCTTKKYEIYMEKNCKMSCQKCS